MQPKFWFSINGKCNNQWIVIDWCIYVCRYSESKKYLRFRWCVRFQNCRDEMRWEFILVLGWVPANFGIPEIIEILYNFWVSWKSWDCEYIGISVCVGIPEYIEIFENFGNFENPKDPIDILKYVLVNTEIWKCHEK